jgi:hypothetical protein
VAEISASFDTISETKAELRTIGFDGFAIDSGKITRDIEMNCGLFVSFLR